MNWNSIVQNLLDTFSTAYFTVEQLLGLLLGRDESFMINTDAVRPYVERAIFGRVPCIQWELMLAHSATPISGLQKPISTMRRSGIKKDNHFSPEAVRHATETQLK